MGKSLRIDDSGISDAGENLVHHSGPGRLARPYPVEDLHLLSFASFPGALRVGPTGDIDIDGSGPRQ